ncbi:MAG: SpoVG family protein [Pirellulaceae bacterium]
MEITSIQVELANVKSERLRGFCRIVFDNAFLVSDIRILESDRGFFVAMPSRKVARPCNSCGEKNHLAARFCNQCGKNLPRATPDKDSSQKAFVDVAHPINSDCREKIHSAIVEAFKSELARSEGLSDDDSQVGKSA